MGKNIKNFFKLNSTMSMFTSFKKRDLLMKSDFRNNRAIRK